MTPTTRTRRSTVALTAATLLLTLAACGSQEEPEVVEETVGGGVAEQESGADAGQETSAGTVETGSDETGGDETGGDETGGDETGGDETGGDEIGGDEIGGDASGEVEAAKAGLARYLEANRPETPQTSTNIPGCPVVEVGVLEQALADVGYPDTTLGGWGTEIEWNEYEDISPDLMGVACGGDSDGNPNDSDFGTAGGMVAVDLSGHTDFSTFLGDMGLTAEGDASGDTATFCPEAGLCLSLWHSDGLVIGTTLMADGADEERVGTMLDLILPDALTALAAN